MGLSKPMQKLQQKWQTKRGWPKHLASLQLKGIRGWTGQIIPFDFPMIAICGENGSGKSTILQAAAAAYKPEPTDASKGCFASTFFPDTPWEKVRDAEIKVTVREGGKEMTSYIGKQSLRWRRNPLRRSRTTTYKDLGRVMPISIRPGYPRMTKPGVSETGAAILNTETTTRLSDIMGREYQGGKVAITNLGKKRPVTVFARDGNEFSGFHQGSGETMIGEILDMNPPNHSLVLIDEVETSLHPSAQRRLIRDLAELCRTRELQVILTTHSPYVLAELPPEGRAHIFVTQGTREVVFGVSPEFAMTKMDEVLWPEFDLYVEDKRAEDLLREILAINLPDDILRFQFIPYGAASVGISLGTMVKENKWKRPSRVYLDGDQDPSPGCFLLPGNDAPEVVVFEGLKSKNWAKLSDRLDRPFANVADACVRSMATEDHHEWVSKAASKLSKSGDVFWALMCQEWVANCLTSEEAKKIVEAVSDLLLARPFQGGPAVVPAATLPLPPSAPKPVAPQEKEPQPGQALLSFPQFVQEPPHVDSSQIPPQGSVQ